MPKRHDHIILNRLRAATALISAVSLFVTQSTAYALPAGGQVNAGTADIIYARARVNITQSSQDAVIDWSSFNIGSGEAVQFYQPSAASIALNRIHDANPSAIEGSLTANGQVWLVNPNGIMFGKGAEVNVGGLLATTSDIDNDRFMSGDYTFSHPGNPLASIFNAGHIQIADGGIAALVGPNVTNGGLIEARLGKVQLGSGDTFTFDLYGDGLINLAASPAITSQLIRNSGSIIADGGSVLLTAAAAGNVVNSLIDMSGIIQANSVGNQDGHVTLYAEGSNAVPGNIAADKGLLQGQSAVQVSGTINAIGRNAGEKGGIIEALADWVGIKSGATLNASGDSGGGTIRVGGDFHGQGATPTASTTIVEGSTNLYTNATNSGKGGNVAVWSDGNTSFSGNIEAKGGPNGGNGGFVETSGHELTAIGTVNAGAPKGNAGTWLLDPTNILIDQTTCTGTGCATANAIGTSLATTNVTITTTTGSITLDKSTTITDSGSGNTTLDFEAGTDILIGTASGGGSITESGSGKLNVTFDADTASLGGGIVMYSGSSITTNGGAIIMGGKGSPASLAATGDATNTAGINLNGATLNSMLSGGNGGAITLTGTGYAGTTNDYGIELQGASVIETNGTGTIGLTGTGGAGTTGDIGIYMTGTNTQKISAGNGAITLNGTGAGSSTGGFGIEVSGAATAPLTTTTGSNGTITLTGIAGSATTYGINATDTTQTDFIESGGTVVLDSSKDILLSKANINYTGSAINVTLDSNYSMATPTNGAISITSSSITTDGGSIILGGGTSPASTGAIGNLTNTAGINLNGATLNSMLSGGNGGAITLTGTGYAGTTNDYGIELQGASVIETNGTGTIGLTGTGGAGTTGDIGIYMTGTNTQKISAGNGAITLNGTGAGSSTGSYGIFIGGATAPLITTTGSNGTITLTGITGGTTTYGINATDTTQTDFIESGGTVVLDSSKDIVLNKANINYTGSAINVTLDSNYSVATPTNGAISITSSSITTDGGSITLGGGTSPASTGAIGNSTNTAGINLNGATLNSMLSGGNGGAITLTGTGYAGTTNDYGIELQGASVIETNGTGTISLTGTGTGSSTGGYGIYSTASSIQTSGNGTISLTGTGGGTSGYGVDLVYASAVPVLSSANGNINITGTGAGAADVNLSGFTNNANVSTSGPGTISITGLGTAISNGVSIGSSTAFDYYTLASWSVSTNSNLTYGMGITKTTGGDTTWTIAAPNSITFSGSSGISSTSGILNLVFDADTGGGSGYVSLGSGTFNSNGGNIAIGGGSLVSGLPSSASVGNSAGVAGINLNGTKLSAGGGNITLMGTGYAGTTNDYGIELQSTASLTTINSGAISLTGHGGNGTTGDVGIFMTGVNTQSISTGDGNITLNGTGAGNSTGGYGISIVGGASSPLIKSTGTGAINLTGTVGGTSTTGILTTATTQGDFIESGNTVTLTSNKDISLTKTNINYTGGSTINVVLDSDATNGGTGAILLSSSNVSTDGGNITLGGGGNPLIDAAYGSSSNTVGVELLSSNLLAGSGNISIDGNGNGHNVGVYISGSDVKTTGGTLNITGVATSGNLFGAEFINSDIENLGSEGINITGNSFGSADGITFSNSSVTDAIHANGGTVTLTANADITLTDANIKSPGSDAFNVVMDADTSGNGGSIMMTNGTIATNGGYITMGGGSNPLTGVADAWRYRSGIQISNATVNAGGGTITMTGEGPTIYSDNQDGIEIDGSTVIKTSGLGNINLTGTGGLAPPGGNYSYGVAIRSSGTSTGVFTQNGDININAYYHPGSTENNSQPFIQTYGNVIGATGSGNLTLTSVGTQYDQGDVYADPTAGNQLGTSTMTGNITLNFDSTKWRTLNIVTLGDLIIQPHTSGTTIGLFDAPGTLNIGQYPDGGAGTGLTINAANTIIGNATSGDINVNGYNWSGNLSLRSAGNITTTGITDLGGHNFTAQTGTGTISLDPVQNASSIMATTGGNMILTGALSASGAGTAITLVDGGSFTNEAGASALTASGGNWLVYSGNPADDILDGISADFHRYSCTYGGSCPSLGSGNGLLYSISPTITVTANDVSGTYGNLAPFSASYSGFINGDTAGTALNGSPALTTNATLSGSSNYNAGTWTITSAAGTLASALGYQLNYVSGTLTVSTKALTISGLSGTNKVYDGTTVDPVTGTASLSGTISGDIVNLSKGSASFADANVGTSKPVTFSGYSISGADAADYSLLPPATSSANITAATLTIAADNKSKDYGAALPNLTWQYSGLATGDTSSVFTGALSTPATALSYIGNYSINQGTLSAGGNYAISFIPGTLTVNPTPAPNFITLPASVAAEIYGQAPIPNLNTSLQVGYVTPAPATNYSGITSEIPIYADTSLLRSQGYGENDPHPWWDGVIR